MVAKNHKVDIAYEIAISGRHADCLADAETVGELIQAQVPDTQLEFTYGFIESGVGSSVGPGTIIVDFYGDGALRKVHNG